MQAEASIQGQYFGFGQSNYRAHFQIQRISERYNGVEAIVPPRHLNYDQRAIVGGLSHTRPIQSLSPCRGYSTTKDGWHHHTRLYSSQSILYHSPLTYFLC